MRVSSVTHSVASRPPTPHAAPWDTEGQAFTFVGRRNTLMLVRYTASEIPVYDELLLAQPRKVNGIWGSHVTHMYVSNQISVDHGRGIWHLPKKLAAFDWRTDAAGRVRIAVRLPGEQAPLFRATITKPAQWLAVPSRIFPLPPLLQNDLYDGTQDVFCTRTRLGGSTRPAHLIDFETDGAEMPSQDRIGVFAWGVNMEPMKFHIPVPEVLRPQAP